MKEETPVALRAGIALAGGVLLSALPLNVSLKSNGAPELAFKAACAATGPTASSASSNGSCINAINWSCFWNGVEHPNMKWYVC
jgi:hypothetical protein